MFAVACSSPPTTLHAAPPPAPRRVACAQIAARCDAEVHDASVQAVVRQRCFGCHDAGGLAHHDFTTLDALRAAPIANMVGTCQMPPDSAPPLPLDERTLLVTWSACQVGATGK